MVRASGPLMLVEPLRMTVSVQGAGSVLLPAESGTPLGDDARCRVDVLGWSATETELEIPSLSVAVRRISRYEGYSWSGASRVKDFVFDLVWIVCVWHLGRAVVDDHRPVEMTRAEVAVLGVGRHAADADPVAHRPAARRVAVAGALITGTGAALSVSTVSVTVSVSPLELWTRSLTWYTPGVSICQSTSSPESSKPPSL